MALWNDVMRCSRPASILLLAVALLVTCGVAFAGDISEDLHLLQQQQQRVSQQQQPVEQQQQPVEQQQQRLAQQQEQAVQQRKPAAQQQQRAVQQQHASASAPLLLLASGGAAAAPAAADLEESDAEVRTAAAAEVLRMTEERKQQHLSTPTKKKKQPQARKRRKGRRLLQLNAGATPGGLLLDRSAGAGAAAVPAADPSYRAATQPTAACPAEHVAATQPSLAAGHRPTLPLQWQKSRSSEGYRSSRCIRHSSRGSSWESSSSSSWGFRDGEGGTGHNEKNKSSSRRISCNKRSSSRSGRQSTRRDCLSSGNTKWNSLSRCSRGGNDSSTKTGEGTSGSSNSSRNAAEPRVWPAADIRPHAFAAAVATSPFVDADTGQSSAIVAVVGAAAAKMLAFFALRGVTQPQSSTAAVAVSLAVAVATYPAAAATPSAAAVASSLTSSGPPSSASSSFVSSFPASSPSSASSSASSSSFTSSSSNFASLASQGPTATSAKPRAAGVHALETAAADTKDMSLLQQKQRSQQREHQQKQSDSSSRSRSSFQGGQQQEKLRLQPVGQKQQQLEKEKENNQLLQLSGEHSTNQGKLSLRPSAHLAKIYLRQEQQQQPEDLKDEDWTSRVRVSSRSLYAPEKTLLHVAAAAPPGPPRSWEAEGRDDEGEPGDVPEEATAAAAAVGAAGESEAAGDHRSSSAAESKAAAAAGLAKAEWHPGNGSTVSGSDRKALATPALLKAKQQQLLEKRQQHGDDGGKRPRQKIGSKTPRQRDLPEERVRIALLQENQWREGVDNKRFPCVVRGKTTDGSVIKQVDNVRTEHKCQRLCRREAKCTHAVLNTETNVCYLKTGVIDLKAGAAADVIIPYNCADCWHLSTGMGGPAFLNRKLYSPFGCLTYCLAQPRCTWWQYNVYDEKCFLFAEASEANMQKNKPNLVVGWNGWCPLNDAEQQELEAPEEGEAHLGSGWIRSQCMQPPHTKSLGNPFEQFSSVGSADLCQKECQKRPLCRYMDFNRTDSVCRLFEKGGYNVKPERNFVAGPRTCNMSCFLGGRKIPFPGPGDTEGVWEVKAETTMDCQVKCSEDIRCKKFSYCTESGQCILSSKGPSRAQSPGDHVSVEGEEESDEGNFDAAEQELSYGTREAAGCYVGPANFCTSRGY